jgi:hypothetical protein
MSFIFGDKPKAPDPSATAGTQQQYNIGAAKSQNQINSYNQSNPFGSMTYVADPSSPSGYRLDTSLNPQSQSILDTQRGTAADLAKNSAGMYSKPFDAQAAASPIAGMLNKWKSQYLQPIFDQQSSNVEAQLRNQGLAPGSEAYNNAKNLLARNQGDVTNDYLTKNQGQAFNQAVTEYGIPLQTMQGLMSTMPGNPQFGNTPTASIQPANYQGAVQSNYEQEMKNYENNVNGVGKLLTSGIGLAAAPFTGGMSMASFLPGMFGGSGGANPYGSMPKIGGGWG